MINYPGDWFVDFTTPDLAYQFSIKGRVLSRKTKLQQAQIVDTPTFGKCLILDGKVQSTELDEFIYHEALVHPSLILHPQPEKIFIAGGGEGAVLREVLSHKTVKEVIMVDIDEEIINISREFLPGWHQGAFQDKRTSIHFSDARGFLAETEEKYDIIILDLPDPLEEGPSQLLFTREFYLLVKNHLKEGGLVSLQAESPSLESCAPFLAIINTLRAVFSIVAPYCTGIPSFGSEFGFAIASQKHDPLKISPEKIDSIISRRVSKKLKFYDGITHQGIFSLPKHLREKIEKEEKIITGHKPLAI